ncbi:Nramp family divalent metal transporter [Actinopolyspora saharensis]|uniref:Mn2+ and Fe2+ transporters of the NRAMP family n=1 Tax=Actinopolyspora saharensis TaxID=995062 RepID=A0A1H0Y8C9_9ACTN|nr:Nramp family divalent metal transporter [Actinopolyspora saharensis]SDQ11425.1 Mn2+ and Fe2+ transporters of the NRAMP family [Actinopolyspora saharensis]
MTTETSAAARDPYVLTADEVKEPPAGWRGSLRFLGPGLILSASIVGSGELIATTALGAEAGFALLWLVVFSTLVKVAVQVELGRWSIVTGQTALEGYNKVPPRFRGLGWISLLWILMAVVKVLQVGGVVGGLAAALSILVPIGSGPLEFTSLAIWTAVVVVAAIVSLYSNKYTLIERGAVGLTVIFVLITCVIAFGLPFTEVGYGLEEVRTGLSFTIPGGAVGAAIAMFGLTGVTSDEITYYTYWCIEKGYARWVGPNDGSPEWRERAKGWIRVMYRDALLSWLVYTVGTMAFFIMGAAVLHPAGLVPEGNDMITTLSHTYTETLGEWASTAYLLGAVAVLGSTLWAALPSWTRVAANAVSVCGGFDWRDTARRTWWMRAFTVAFPITWGAAYLYFSSPVFMVQTGGFIGGVFLIAVTVATWYLRRNEVDEGLRGGRWFSVALTVSSLLIVGLGVYTAISVFGGAN